MKKIERVLIALLVSAFSISLAGCGGSSSSSDSAKSKDNTLTVYTPNSEQLVNAVVPSFEKKTGIKVDVITAGTGELMKRVTNEKENPLGDVLWGGDATMLSPIKNLFVKYVSSNDANMRDDSKNTTGYFSSYTADGSVIIVNKNLIGNIKVEGFQDLLNPALKGKIAFCDASNSSSAFEQVVNMLYDMGKDSNPDSPEAWNYVGKFLANLDGKVASSSGTVHKSVADGEYPVGLTWEDPAATYVKEGAPVKVIYPKEGVIFANATVQIIKNCKHQDNAKKFIDYLLSPDVQNILGTKLTNRPLMKNPKLGSYMEPMEKMTIMTKYDPKWVSDNKAAIVKHYQELLKH